jgi:hypothetical protein
MEENGKLHDSNTLPLEKKSPLPIGRRLGKLQNRSGRYEKKKCPLLEF